MSNLNINYLSTSISKTTIHNVLTEGIKSVWEKDEEVQTGYLRAVVEGIRKNTGEDATKMVEYLKNLGAFFVPNDEYLLYHFGPQIKSFEFGCYKGEYCTIYQSLAIPLRFLDEKLIGFVGYDNGNYAEDPNTTIKYLYPPKHVWDKSRFMFVEREEMLKAIEDGYIFIVDGIFDKIKLQTLGYNAVSLCGSALTKWHESYLSVIKHKIVLPDNDSAGTKLSSWCRKRLKGCIEFKQGDEWDVDDWLKTEEGKLMFENLFNESKAEGFLLNKISREFGNKLKRG